MVYDLNKTDTFYAGSSPLKAKCVRYILPHFDTFSVSTPIKFILKLGMHVK